MRMKANCCGRERIVRAAIFMAAALLCVASSGLRAQDATVTQPVQMMAKDADPDWEVATVKPSDPNVNDYRRIRTRGGHVVILGYTAEETLLMGYSMQKSQVVGEPDWVKTERWDIDGLANADGEPNLTQLQSMMRKILAERFGLKLHREQREMSVFVLTIVKGGPKLTPNTSDPNGTMHQRYSPASDRAVDALTNTSMPELAQVLQFHVDRPVVDQTGLKGRYDFQLKWLTDDSHATDPDAPPGLFTAIQEQLGLKLEPVKAPADVLVIDKVERPGEN